AGAGDHARRRTHAALADALDADSAGDRRAWHRAAATAAADEDVAAELEAAADRARQQGGYAASAAYLKRAAELTPESRREALRLLRAAADGLTSGRPALADVSLARCIPMLGNDYLVAQARRVQGAVRFSLGKGFQSPSIMLAAADGLYGFDPRVARET